MAGIVKVGSGPPEMPRYAAIEPLMAELAGLREAVAIATEPSAELLTRIDTAIETMNAEGPLLAAASEPGGSIAVGTYLAMLQMAYPNAGQQDATGYGGFLYDDVMELAPPIAAVEMACRHWRQKSKFLPAIAELLVEVRAAKSQIENAVEFVARLPAVRERLARELGQS